MASLSRDSRSGVYYVQFRFQGRHLNKSLKITDEKKAQAYLARVQETLADIERGRMVSPPGAAPWTFIRTDGRQEQKQDAAKVLTLGELFKWYNGQRTPDANGPKTIKVEGVHQGHFLRILKGAAALLDIKTDALQRYINTRAKE